MKELTTFGRSGFALAIMVFGVQHFSYRDFVTRVVPWMPGWLPGHSVLAVLCGALLIALGALILSGRAARPAALLLGLGLLASFALLHLPWAIVNPDQGGLWTNAGKALALAGGALLTAGSLPRTPPATAGRLENLLRPLEDLIPRARHLLSLFLILCGVQHFIYVDFVMSLVPGWIPGPRFWTCFTGVALIAGGLGISFRPTTRLAAALSSLMIFLWVMLLHIPRALADLHNSNETTAVFEALALSGTALLIAVRATQPQRVTKAYGSS
ncbi:MAG TPA: hypothetical protein VJ302_19120 [Blastocatellia bacterium]|nr:hypothetical protein [Blastocatellia bacterium]